MIGISIVRPRRFFLAGFFLFEGERSGAPVGGRAQVFGRRSQIHPLRSLTFPKQMISLLLALLVYRSYISPFSRPIRVLDCEILCHN